jgi:acyl-CoA dehydrogenase
VSFELSEKHQALLNEARALALSVEFQAPIADESEHLDPIMYDALKKSGLAALCVPAAHGGRDEKIDSLAVTVVREGLMYVSGHLDTMFAMQGIGSFGLSVAGNPALQEEWLPRVASLEVLAGLALTEPDVGSDLKAITTTATPRGDTLIVNGKKAFITNAGAAGFYSVLCKEGEGYSLVLVPGDAPGLTTISGPRLIAPHIIGELHFEDVEVPATNRIGEPGRAFPLVLATLGTFRVSVAGAAVGLAQAALDEAVRHTNTREQFGQLLAEAGPIPHYLGTSWMELEMARALVYRAAARSAIDPRANLHWASMAKVAATEAAGRIADRSVQLLGRFGITDGSKVDRLYREARPMRIYEGGNEVLIGQLAKTLGKDYLSSVTTK